MSQPLPPTQPPVPSQQVSYRQPDLRTDGNSGTESYNRVAETVGMMPTLRVKDNVVQAIVVLIGAMLGALIGYFVGSRDPRAAVLGGFAGLIVFGLVSGIVLMVLGWVRAARRQG